MKKLFAVSKTYSLKEANKIAISKINNEFYYMQRIVQSSTNWACGEDLTLRQKYYWFYEFGNERPTPTPCYQIFKNGKRIHDFL